MSGDAAPLRFVPPLPPEEAARADFYGLLARLFYAAPDAALLGALAEAEEIVAEESGGDEGAGLALAWRDLTLAAASADAAAVDEEYQALFVGAGKSPVSLYAGAYLMKSAIDAPLVELRDVLAARGIARRAAVFEPEDHFAALCELMRYLIAAQRAPLEEQVALFSRFLWPATEPLCKAICKLEQAVFYRAVANFAMRFLKVEDTAFHM